MSGHVLRYPAFPDMGVTVGSRVRSFDFEGRTDCYMEGVVARIAGERYEILVDKIVFASVPETPAGDYKVYPPVNGLQCMFGGKTRGVCRIDNEEK